MVIGCSPSRFISRTVVYALALNIAQARPKATPSHDASRLKEPISATPARPTSMERTCRPPKDSPRKINPTSPAHSGAVL